MFGQNYPQMNPKNASDTFGTHWGRQRKQKQQLKADTKSGGAQEFLWFTLTLHNRIPAGLTGPGRANLGTGQTPESTTMRPQ